MEIAQEEVNNLQFDRVHRMGVKRDNSVKSIVAKFTLFKERESVRKQAKILKDTNYYTCIRAVPKGDIRKKKTIIEKDEGGKGKGKQGLGFL